MWTNNKYTLGHDFAKRCVISLIILLIVYYGYMKLDLTNESKVIITFSRTLKNILQIFEWWKTCFHRSMVHKGMVDRQIKTNYQIA
jgi:hypothetical protein